ncbi:hypothetical protein DESC_720492 [Desulfosarcina cetonica]|nr:hypothetical protein DESC_720492 [Desulfosarcina cetonica]
MVIGNDGVVARKAGNRRNARAFDFIGAPWQSGAFAASGRCDSHIR